MPCLPFVTATRLAPPPGWALLQRKLMDVMEEGAEYMIGKHAENGGVITYADDMDDLYEQVNNWGLFYAMGASKKILTMALESWNATTRFHDRSIKSRVHPRFHASSHKEYYSINHPGDAEWHHKGEGNMAFYDFGVADPTISENVRRARRFAGYYIGEDPEAPNWDPKYRILRSPAQSGEGPWHKTTTEYTHSYLLGGKGLDSISWYGVRSSLQPFVKDLEPTWWKDPKRRDEINALFEKLVLNTDSSNNLAATALVTNAYLYTGDEKYRRWVLDYVEAWIDRTKQNGGILPDNVGPTGKVGENRNGQWWGGLYGWNHYQGYNIMFHGLVTAVECAQLLSGDSRYLELLRSQIRMLLSNGKRKDNGQLVVPNRYTAEGWAAFMPMRIFEIAHLYHGSLSKEDYDLFCEIRAGDVERNWNVVEPTHEKNQQLRDGHQHMARFQYYDGKNPGWPEQILSAEFVTASDAIRRMKAYPDDMLKLIENNDSPDNPVVTKGLTQTMLGAPQSNYNGGLLRATVRYFDADRARPGLPPDVAAFVDEIKDDQAGIRLVNMSMERAANVIVQAGAFGEHTFTEVRYGEDDPSTIDRKKGIGPSVIERTLPVHGKHFAVSLPPGKALRVQAGMKRFSSKPSYGFPWHGEKIPAPFQ
ncbi:MAG: hypothetical protein FJ319_00805 [SAR202 cluster bacterium]|nr:hypothetical protein [SAR202 cluster bacterium]